MLRKTLCTSAVLGVIAVGCSYEGDGDFGADGRDGPGGVLGGSSGASGSNGGPEPVTCQDGKKSEGESDVDCGGRCDAKCAVGQQCGSAADCADGNLCTGGVCAAPNGTDGVKNGDESDVDCGGTTTGAGRCLEGKACNASADCAGGGCSYSGVCVASPSCTVRFGGDTCGVGEIGSGAEQHESCCTSLPVQGFNDANHPGKTVYLDKYEVTAGRVRAFIESVKAQYGGVPNVRQWIADHPPAVWNAGWNQYLTQDMDSDTGLNLIFGAYNDYSSVFYIHGQNCHLYPGSYGYATWYYPPDVLTSVYGSPARYWSQDDLDTRVMTCIPNAMLAAFCAWDGGQLATAAVLDFVTASGSKLPTDGINVSGDGGQTPTYVYPGFANQNDQPDWDGANRVSPPGRALPEDNNVPGDRLTGPGGEVWADLGGNMVEQVIVDASSTDAFNVLYDGVGSGSVRAGGNSMEEWSHPNWKAAGTGGRCMRFQ